MNTSAILEQTDKAVQKASPWIEGLGRFGYAARGIVYALVGWFAILAATGMGGGITGQRGAMRWLEDVPFGVFLLFAIALGLIGYALWRLVQAIRDTEGAGKGFAGIIKRTGFVFTALGSTALAISAIKIALAVRERSENTQRSWTAWLLSQPFGALLVSLIGLIIIGIGIFQFYKAYQVRFREKLMLHQMSHGEQKWITRFGRFGLVSRGVVFGLIGGFLVVAAIRSDPRETRGLGGALWVLSQQAYGKWLLGITAAGLIAYGLYSVILARYRRIVIR